MRLFSFVICAYAALWGARGTAEPLQLDGHWAIYLPETDQVRFLARFDRAPVFPDDFVSLHVFPYYDAPNYERTARIWSRSIVDDTIGIENFSDGTDLGFEVGRVRYAIEDNRFSVVVPFESLNVNMHEFHYIGFAGGRGYYSQAQIGVPEPSALLLGLSGALVGTYLVLAKRRRRIGRRVGLNYAKRESIPDAAGWHSSSLAATVLGDAILHLLASRPDRAKSRVPTGSASRASDALTSTRIVPSVSQGPAQATRPPPRRVSSVRGQA